MGYQEGVSNVVYHTCEWLTSPTDPVDQDPATAVVPLWEGGVVGPAEEAEHQGGGQAGTDVRTLPPPLKVVQ